jgi:hypothetical protein
MRVMFEKVKKQQERVHANRGRALPSKSVGVLFHLCSSLKVLDCVKYLALEIYDW